MTRRALFFAASRWAFSGRRKMSLSRTILAAAGIAAGVTALIVVTGVMGGLQQGYIDAILNVSSFHLRVEVPESYAASSLDALRALPGVASVVAFKETHVLAQGLSGQAQSLNLRAFQKGSEVYDKGLIQALGLAPGSLLPPERSILLGANCALSLGAGLGEEIELFGMTQSPDEGLKPLRRKIGVGGLFNSGYYEFDSSMGFVSLEAAEGLAEFFPSSLPFLGIKLENRYADYRMAETIRKLLPAGAGAIVSWRDYNRSFFGALRTEKTIMTLLISLIFVVVGINIFHAMRRAIAAKMPDIALLKACGASDADIRSIFALGGLAIGLMGAAAGTAAGLVLSANVNAILDAAAAALRFFASLLSSLGLAAPGGDFRLFSPSYFYIDKIPVSLPAADILFIALTAAVSAALAAAAAARRVSAARPAEVFRNE